MKVPFLTFLMLILAACSEPKKDPVKTEDFGEPEKTGKEKPSIKTDSIGVFKWNSELCENESTFNARLYTVEELKGTNELLWMAGSLLLHEINNTATQPDEIEELSSLKELDMLYQKKQKALQNLKIVNDPFWRGVKQSILKGMKDEYDLARIDIQAYTNPAVLKGNRFSTVCPDIIDALTDKDTTKLMAAWLTLVEEQSRRNGSPENVLKRYRNQYNSPDRIMQARVQLITYGWHNRVNHTLRRVERDEKMNDKFNRLFLETKSECDEP
jgi:hypothetical protein